MNTANRLSPADRNGMRREYGLRDPRVIRLLDQIEDYERRIAQSFKRDEAIEARLIRDVPRRATKRGAPKCPGN